MGVFSTAATSNHVEFPSPVGFGAFGLFQMAPSWVARLSIHRVYDETAKEGLVCRVASQRIGCVSELTETSISLTGLRGSLLWMRWFGDQLRLGLGGGGSFNQVRVEALGESGRRADFLHSNSGKIGFHGDVALTVVPYPRIPVRITGGLTSHWVYFHTCSGEDPPQYDPLCEPGTFWEAEMGLSYDIPRR